MSQFLINKRIMFVCFVIKEDTIKSLKTIYPNQGFFCEADKSDVFFKKILEQSKDSSGVLDGSKLSSITFPLAEHYDVFISYSHNDKNTVKFLYWYLTYKCGLSVFFDATIWHSADRLLKKIDNEYCINEKKDAYIYEKRNFSTSHVHTLLGMAMMEAIKKSELFIFIESEHSVTLSEGIANSTLSPWIYQEIQYANSLPSETPDRYKCETRLFSSRTQIINEHRELQIKYPTHTNGFYRMECQTLNKMSRYKGQASLNILYLIKSIITSNQLK